MTGIVPLGRLVGQVMQVEPYRSARTVYSSWLNEGCFSIVQRMALITRRKPQHLALAA